MIQKKRLGEIALLQRGLTYNKGDEVPASSKIVLRSNNIDLESHSIDLSELKYLREDFVIPEDRKVKKDSIFICMSNGSKQHVGKVAFIDRDMDYAFGGFMGLIVPKSSISAKYVFYACNSSSYRTFLSQIGNGIGITNLRFSELEKFEIPVPSIEYQQRIVDELDLLTGIIDKKNAQLRDLDALAQSTFMEMFGDPVSNEKGWPVKSIGEFADVTDYVANGSFASLRANVSYKSEPDYAILVRLADYTNGFDKSKFVYVDKHAYDFLVKSRLVGGEIIMSNVGSVGKSFLCPDLGMPMSLAPNSILIKTPNNVYSFACYLMPSFQQAIKGITSQTALPKFNKTEFKKIRVIWPPENLQKEYEEKWRAIQVQKEIISSSLKDSQNLLNSRMDYYFNE